MKISSNHENYSSYYISRKSNSARERSQNRINRCFCQIARICAPFVSNARPTGSGGPCIVSFYNRYNRPVFAQSDNGRSMGERGDRVRGHQHHRISHRGRDTALRQRFPGWMASPRPGHVSRSWPRIHFCTYIFIGIFLPLSLSLCSLRGVLFLDVYMHICFDARSRSSFKFLTMRERLGWCTVELL